MVFFAGIMFITGARCRDYIGQFAHDSRTEYYEWATENMPPDSRIAQDIYVRLPEEFNATNSKGTHQVKVDSFWAVGELEKLSKARGMGYTHVAVCSLSYARFFEPNAYSLERKWRSYRWNAHAFYSSLFQEGELLWESIPSHIMEGFTNPVVRFYRITRDAVPRMTEAGVEPDPDLFHIILFIISIMYVRKLIRNHKRDPDYLQ